MLQWECAKRVDGPLYSRMVLGDVVTLLVCVAFGGELPLVEIRVFLSSGLELLSSEVRSNHDEQAGWFNVPHQSICATRSAVANQLAAFEPVARGLY